MKQFPSIVTYFAKLGRRAHWLGALLASVATLGCSDSADDPEPAAESTAPCEQAAQAGFPFGVQCGQWVDTEGRVVFLRGINARIDGIFDVSFDDGRTALENIPSFSASDAAEMREFGFDALRLPINWSGLEPSESGGFAEDYLLEVERVVELAHAEGLVVLLDMHQDAYSKHIGEDGAPLWAIQPPPTSLLEGPLTDLEQRRLSAQVLDAFETFFGETAQGTELRTRFVRAARHLVERFADHPGVMGLEIFNEPQADDAGVARLNQAAYGELRDAAPNKPYLFEPPVTRNFTDASTLPQEPLGPMTGYAPHVYTFAFVATEEQRLRMTKELLRRSNANARLEADAWAAPLVITEWGYDPNGTKAEEYLTWQSELQEEYQASSFFWVWKEESQGRWGCFDYDDASGSYLPRERLRTVLARVRPAAVAGWPSRFGFDRPSGVFEMTFMADPTVQAPHRIAIAPALGQATDVRCDDQPASWQADGVGVISVECGNGSSTEHVLRVEVAPAP